MYSFGPHLILWILACIKLAPKGVRVKITRPVQQSVAFASSYVPLLTNLQLYETCGVVSDSVPQKFKFIPLELPVPFQVLTLKVIAYVWMNVGMTQTPDSYFRLSARDDIIFVIVNRLAVFISIWSHETILFCFLKIVHAHWFHVSTQM